ncbi:SelR-domain-containing protein [Cryphonectria parasitica EP155]|uniref:Peptide-methionine (R)-S-oxide reductase n=1 Tax=Cryphonectria parasitica (strain ATCC 38755 / EP155) TaxID=660469 RepID=A0A9P4XVW8_CRYP1|nr:SelR-domain-containing protein [Cryphonectria parasitica EP155]KAF3761787.1 SelR-domain-containing protein [Cryphonectria parasitica EP155]
MRFQFSSVLQTLYTLSSLNRARASQQIPLLQSLPQRATALRSMPSIPILGSLFGTKATDSSTMSFPDKRTDDEWRAVLNKEQFRILREKGTEPPGSGKFDKHYPSEGVYTCAGCEAPLYKATHKFSSGCGWPAYFDSIPGAVVRHEDNSMFMKRIEIMCANCGGHLGHVFKGEGFPNPTDERHCVNSVSLNFSPQDKIVKDDAGADGEAKE